MFLVIPTNIYERYRGQFERIMNRNIVIRWLEEDSWLIFAFGRVRIRTGSKERSMEFMNKVAVYGGEIRLGRGGTSIIIEQKRNRRMHIRIEPELHRALHKLSDKYGVSVVDVVNSALIYFFVDKFTKLYMDELLGGSRARIPGVT